MSLIERVDAAVDAALVQRIVGCVILIKRDGEEVYARAAGPADREANMPMRREAIFRLASVTKPIVATAVLRLVDLGLIGLNDRVTRYLPWFTPDNPDGSKADIRIRHLLSHTSGLAYGNVPDDASGGLSGPVNSLTETLQNIAKVRLAFAPGTGWDYGTSIDVLGGVLAAINGSNVEDALGRYVTGPLDMTDAHFYVTDKERLATPYADGNPPVRMGEPHAVADRYGTTVFSPGRIFNPAAPQNGGAGMAGTADDVMKLLEVYNGNPGLLAPETMAMALANQIGDLPRREVDAGKRFSFIGALLQDPMAANNPCPVGTVDWGGAWGHNWVVDPVNRMTTVVCTNTTFEGCNGPFRDDILQAVYAA
ncbi:serine hydrolase domain-containing protein [Devosia ginsengisoli]|uniref:Beta-lactamase family protein n=1 Tax=Devosia ginsengisoli TaxID=400770 RepID=A0A5B8LP63_9HYPH|nr:serine hydrolase domain-containing protein [Devosia ginsengisoli]QDZ10058.1 beta-lactamase family protein [Devosia ginsengisoli]